VEREQRLTYIRFAAGFYFVFAEVLHRSDKFLVNLKSKF
jgi:hypothetical protein